MSLLNDIYQAMVPNSDMPHWSTDNNAWLGPGFYFWDSSIKWAHWWGKGVLKNNYIICHSKYNCKGNNFFDLVGDTNHKTEFSIACNVLKKHLQKRGKNMNSILAKDVIMALKLSNQDFFLKYKAIRMFPQNSTPISKDKVVYFQHGKDAFDEIDHPIQLCVWDKDFFQGGFDVVE